MRFDWDEQKNTLNLKRHRVRFETASLAFEDPVAITLRDVLHEETRNVLLLWPDTNGHRGLCRTHKLRDERRGSDSDNLRPKGDVAGKEDSMKRLTKEQREDIAALAAMKDAILIYGDAGGIGLEWCGDRTFLSAEKAAGDDEAR